jgi:DNA-directed RNA polymerase specialized sigma24 family protein
MEKGKKCESRAYADACAKMALRELGRQKMGGSKTEPRNKDGGRDHGTIEHVSIDLAELPPLQPSQDRDLMIAGILSRYEEHEQLLLTMRYIWEFEVDEIASFLNVSIPTVYARLRNILVAPDRIYVKRYT